MATKNAHWQAAFRRRMREAGLKAVTVWMPKEGADRLARYPEKERGEVITRALMLLESQGELTGNDATLTGESTDKSTGEGAITVTEVPPLPVSDKLPPERVAALRRRAKTCGLSWEEIARRFNAEGIPSPSGIGHWRGATVAKLVRGE
jgi:hypothetical protein